MANSDISGQITDASGNPIGSAKVYLWREDLAGAGGVVTSTTADSSGNFSFTAHPDGSGSSESWHVAAKDPNANVQLQSAYGVTASPPTSVNSQFNVSITDTSSRVSPGETLTVDASLTNSGTDSDTQTITLDVDNGVGQVDSSLEAAQGGASKTVPLSWSVPSGQTEQDYQATVASADDTASQTVTVSSTPASLISHYTFDDADTNSGTTVDVVGPNDGTLNGGVTTGVSGASQTYTTNEAYSFDGSDDYVAIPRPVDTLDTFSAAMWAKTTATGEVNFVKTRDATSGDGFGMDADSDVLTLVLEDSGTFALVSGSTTINDGNWHHIVGTVNVGGNMTVYVDGTQEGQNTVSGTFTFNDVWAIAAWWDHESSAVKQETDVDIDDVRFYDKELTSTEVSNLYNNGSI